MTVTSSPARYEPCPCGRKGKDASPQATLKVLTAEGIVSSVLQPPEYLPGTVTRPSTECAVSQISPRSCSVSIVQLRRSRLWGTSPRSQTCERVPRRFEGMVVSWWSFLSFWVLLPVLTCEGWLYNVSLT